MAFTTEYKMCHWQSFDFSILSEIKTEKERHSKDRKTFNNVIIAADTETSKKDQRTAAGRPLSGRENVCQENHVVAWTISIRADNRNIVTLYGHKPSTFCECLELIHNSMKGENTICYFHNMAYDWVFLRKFLIVRFGNPSNLLATKPHYPISIEFENGLVLKDSLILAQRDLAGWAEELNVEHKKAIGFWDYNKIRNQDCKFSKEELKYIENDTLALAECIDVIMKNLNRKYWELPLTATGIPRSALYKISRENSGHKDFLKRVLTLKQYKKCEKIYHGGYSHGNRHFIEQTINDKVICYDFASSYPFCLLAYKYPMEKFAAIGSKEIDWILSRSDDYAFMLKLVLVKPRLKDPNFPMPALQHSKCENEINVKLDNGRILCADYCEIYTNEIDLEVLCEQYDFDLAQCVEVEMAKKDYLPRWITDYIFSLFKDKTLLKNRDPILYALAKQKLNSIYGMMCQKTIREMNLESFEYGEYYSPELNEEFAYEETINNKRSILNYQWGTWTTSYAFRNLFKLGKCCEDWLYSDTDSCYGINWDLEKVNEYNENCKRLLRENGYHGITTDKDYWLGVAEFDKEYSEFRVLGSKRYCGRGVDNELHITVAGVPKCGYLCLNNDINNFTKGFVFDGKITGKLTVNYIFTDRIYIDENGNETGDSIDLTQCDYKLDNAYIDNWERLLTTTQYLYEGVMISENGRL